MVLLPPFVVEFCAWFSSARLLDWRMRPPITINDSFCDRSVIMNTISNNNISTGSVPPYRTSSLLGLLGASNPPPAQSARTGAGRQAGPQRGLSVPPRHWKARSCRAFDIVTGPMVFLSFCFGRISEGIEGTTTSTFAFLRGD